MTEAGKKFWDALTPAERQLVTQICTEPESLAELARESGVSYQVRKNQMNRIFGVAGLKGAAKTKRIMLMLLCFQNGVVTCPCCWEKKAAA